MKRNTFLASSVTAGIVASTGLPALAKETVIIPEPYFVDRYDVLKNTLAYKCLVPDYLKNGELAKYDKASYEEAMFMDIHYGAGLPTSMGLTHIVEGEQFLVPTISHYIPADSDFIYLLENSFLWSRRTPWTMKEWETRPRQTSKNVITSESNRYQIMTMGYSSNINIHFIPDGIMQPNRIYELHAPEFLGVMPIRQYEKEKGMTFNDGHKIITEWTKPHQDVGMAIINSSAILVVHFS